MSKRERSDFEVAMAALGAKVPGMQALAAAGARGMVQRLLGFWVMWHVSGGSIEAMIDKGFGSHTGVYRQRAEFHRVFGVPVEDFAPDVAATLKSVT